VTSLGCFADDFRVLTGNVPLRWQERLFHKYFLGGDLPPALDLPTGLGKTSVMTIWYLALKAGAPVPRRLVYVVDRRAVVDQATTVSRYSDWSMPGRLETVAAMPFAITSGAACDRTMRGGQFCFHRCWRGPPSMARFLSLQPAGSSSSTKRSRKAVIAR
jgi:CRISPR-associated endonuclease/helicase Cas3